MSWECTKCDEDHEKPEDCCFCGGEGSDDGEWCDCPSGEAAWKEEVKQYEWMIPLVKKSIRAERDGDYETAEGLRQEAMVRKS